MASKIESLYLRSPIWLQQLAVAAWGVGWRMRRFGGSFARHVRELHDHDGWSAGAVSSVSRVALAHAVRRRLAVALLSRSFREGGPPADNGPLGVPSSGPLPQQGDPPQSWPRTVDGNPTAAARLDRPVKRLHGNAGRNLLHARFSPLSDGGRRGPQPACRRRDDPRSAGDVRRAQESAISVKVALPSGDTARRRIWPTARFIIFRRNFCRPTWSFCGPIGRGWSWDIPARCTPLPATRWITTICRRPRSA